MHYKSGMKKDPDGFTDIEWCSSAVLDSWNDLRNAFKAANARKAIAPTQASRGVQRVLGVKRVKRITRGSRYIKISTREQIVSYRDGVIVQRPSNQSGNVDY